MITGTEAATVAKASASVAQGLKTAFAQQQRDWPDPLESLLELVGIVSEWCDSAAYTNTAVHDAIRARELGVDFSMPPDPEAGIQTRAGIRYLLPGYVEFASRNIGRVLGVPVLRRYGFRRYWLWRYRKRETQVWRTLRSMMLAYCPDLLASFEAAVKGRANVVAEHRQGFSTVLQNPQTPVETLRAIGGELEATLRNLVQTRDGLRDFILANFPLPPGRRAEP